MNVYDLTVFVHVASAVALLNGSVVASPTVRAAVRRARTAQETRAYVAVGRSLSLLEPVSAIIVLASGVYLTSVATFWRLGWVQVSLFFWVVSAVVAAAVVKPALDRVATEVAISPDGDVSHRLETLRWSARWSIGGDLLLANDVAVLYLMTMKPGTVASLLVVVGANVGLAAARAVRQRSRKSV